MGSPMYATPLLVSQPKIWSLLILQGGISSLGASQWEQGWRDDWKTNLSFSPPAPPPQKFSFLPGLKRDDIFDIGQNT